MIQPAAPALMLPSPTLGSCVRGYVSHHCRAKAESLPHRNTHWPAALTCAIAWFWHEGGREPARPVLFSGPRTQAQVHETAGRSFMVLLMPDALRAMAPVNIAQHVNRFSGLAESFDAGWRRMAQAVQDAPNDARRIALIEEFLEPRWRAACTAYEHTQSQFQAGLRRKQAGWADWLQDLSERAHAQGMGRSMRQAQRRMKEWAGLSLRQLQGMVRLEGVLEQVREAIAQAQQNPRFKGQLDWARIAFDNGFADQSHLCREIRRASGLSPTELRRAVGEDEGFWLYRLWGSGRAHAAEPLAERR